jgi:hypothetical protein
MVAMGDVEDRYRAVVPIRCRGALHFYSARDAESDRLRVLVMAPRIPVGEARARLTSLARVHGLVAGVASRVPAVVDAALDAPAPWVALDCDAVADQEHTAEYVRQGGEKPDFQRGAALGKMLVETLIECHRVRDPASGAPVCLGSVAPANILFNAEGRLWLVGFGAGPLIDACIAPEVAMGEPATPGADTYAVTLFMRSQAVYVELPAALQRAFAGRSIEGDGGQELVELIFTNNVKVLAAPPAERIDLEEGIAFQRRMWQLVGIEPDLPGFAAWVARAIASDSELVDAPPRAASDDAPSIRVGRDAEWLETPSGARHALGARRTLRRLLVALAEARRDRAGVALTVEELLHAGWPGEDPLPEAGSNRVYVAISTLRKLGLGESLQRWDGGYRLDPAVPCQF